MKKIQTLILFVLITFSLSTFAQPGGMPKKITITGKVVDKVSNTPLEYATISFQHTKKTDLLTGGITNSNGEFSIEIMAGEYNVKIEYISFKSIDFKAKKLFENTNLGVIKLEEDATQLAGVEVRAEKTSVEIKLDKKVYNVGQDLMVKGGTVSDVLDNVPSISVDSEGNVLLRGSENVRILIDGRPSNAISINDALKLLPADAIDKVEVITNPSARYDAEGSSGIINIVLKKGKTGGINGIITATVGEPENSTITGNFNYKTEKFNLFTTQGYRKTNSPGNFLFESEYLNADGTTKNFINETRDINRRSKAYNGSFGFDWYIAPNATLTNTFSYRINDNKNPIFVNFDSFDVNRIFTGRRVRFNDENSKGENLEFATNFIQKFKKDGHQLTIDFSYSNNKDDDETYISDVILERNFVDRDQNRHLFQLDYILPLNEKSRFEAGYRGDFLETNTDFVFERFITNQWQNQPFFTNFFQYKEKVNAFYSQFGSKINKFNYLLGLRWEDSVIEVNQLTTNDLNTKRYNNFFPSAFLNYEVTETLGLSLSYSKRIQRPRGRQLNPFSNISSNLNIFRGDPDLDPAMTDAFDFGIVKRWEKLTLNTSAYYNKTTNLFQFVRRESGLFTDDNVPVLLTGPVNLGEEERMGFEFTLNYTPYKWWKLNGNFNFFRNETKGEYAFENFLNQRVVINLDNVATSWFVRINSKIILPYKIDWQTNITYNAPQKTAQGEIIGIAAMNLAFSKDILKDKGTLNLSVSDVFNSRKNIFTANIENFVNSRTEAQWRVRQITLSFIYRFNKSKNEPEKPRKRSNEQEGGGDMM
jgi:outer membrane receptor for ferrienterochelin and colicins